MFNCFSQSGQLAVDEGLAWAELVVVAIAVESRKQRKTSQNSDFQQISHGSCIRHNGTRISIVERQIINYSNLN